MNLTKTNWPLLWTPNADQFNGNPDGLLRADNLQLDEEGGLNLTRGIQELNGSLPDYVYSIYSKLVNNQEIVWAGLNATGTSVIRSKDFFKTFTTILTAGGTKPCFGDCLGQVLISSGGQRFKDNGTTVSPLGLKTPTNSPAVTAINQQIINLSGSGAISCTYAAVEGDTFTQLEGSAKLNVDDTTLRAVLECTYANPIDTVHFGIVNENPNVDPGADIFTMLFEPQDSSQVSSLTIEFGLDTTYDNKYWATFSSQGPTAGSIPGFAQGIGASTRVTLKRSDFQRAGSDATLDWTKVIRFRMTMQCISDIYVIMGEQTFTGGVQGSLNGDYTYIAYAVADNGQYRAMSGPSPVSSVQYYNNGYGSISLPSSDDPQVTSIWLYRRSVPDPNNPNNLDLLDQYYKVAEGAPGTTIEDTTTDITALQTNIKANQFLQSIQDVTQPIIGMAGLFNERMLYLTLDTILLSDRLNPDAIDTRYTIKAFGDPTEQNLFLRILTNNTMILATTKDLYYMSGTLLDQPDGTLDSTIQAIGEAYPPLSEDFAFADGSLYYIASDGVRLTTGSNSVRLTGLELLFQGETRYGIAPITLAAGNVAQYALAIGRGKLFLALPTTDGKRYLFIYTFATSRWRLQYTDPETIHVTQSGVVLLGYNLSFNNNLIGGLFQLDVGYGITDSSGNLLEGVPIFFQTVGDHNGQPRNRKETYTLKFIGDTGGDPISIYVAKDGGDWQLVGTTSLNGLGTAYFTMEQFALGFRYAFKIVDNNNLTTFRLKELTLEYDARPEQLTFKRVLPDNLGTRSRKRVTTFALVIDTLGNNVTFTPSVDNVNGTPESFSNPTKNTYVYYFTSETIGTDIGGTLQGGPFEYYGLNLEEIVSEKLPPAAKYLIIPANDYGTPARKRHTSYKFQIDTRNQPITFTPRVDGVTYASAVFTTSTKRTVEYFFDTSIDVKGIDIGGILSASTPFEFYGVVIPEKIETLPPRLESFYIPYDNFGSATRKRIRTIPLIIDTGGSDVSYTPNIDGTDYPALVINTTYKQTVYY